MTTIGIGDSGHVHGLSIVVTGAIGDMRIAADRAGKEWLLAPLYSIPGVYALTGMSAHSRIRGRVSVVDGTLYVVDR